MNFYQHDPETFLEAMLASVPPLHHAELKILFIVPAFHSEEELATILQLPRKTLIEDLENIIRFGVENKEAYKHGKYAGYYTDFILHSLFILGEIGAKESLPLILDFLRQDESDLYYWLGDHVTESMFTVMADAAVDAVETLEKFILDDHVYYYCRSGAIEAIAISFYKKNITPVEFIDSYTRLYARLVENSSDWQMDLITEMVFTISSFHVTALQHIVENAFDLDLVDVGMTGEREDVLELLHSDDEPLILPRPLLDRYMTFDEDDLSDDWEDHELDEEEFDHLRDALKNYESPQPLVRSEPKIGRNDPCPCGSGKKYKKCHGK